MTHREYWVQFKIKKVMQSQKPTFNMYTSLSIHVWVSWYIGLCNKLCVWLIAYRGEVQSPGKSLLPGYRPLATSSLQRGAGLHHAYTDTALSSKGSSMYDEGYTSRPTDSLRSDDGKHERSGSRDSRDSGDYQYLSGGKGYNLHIVYV